MTAAVLPLVRILLSGATLAWRDTAQLQAPVQRLVAPALRAFHLPLWNPNEGTGQPLLAQWLHAVLHPVTAATAFLHLGPDGWLVGMIAFSAAGTWLAARGLGASTAAAAGAAWSYTLSGYLLGMTCNVLYLAGAATAPWVVAALQHAALRGGSAVTLGAATVACAVFSGDPQAVITSLLIAAALAIAATGLKAALPRLATSVLLGLTAAAVQLLPTATYLRSTSRWAGTLTDADLRFWPLDPARLVELVAPGFFVGRPTQWEAPVFQALGSPSPYPLPWAPSVFIGAAVLLLAAATWRTRNGRILLSLAALLGLLALGHHLGAQQLLHRVPIWGSFRYAEKLVGPMTLCLALAAGLGIDAARGERWLPLASLALAALFLAVGSLCALAPAWSQSLFASAGASPDAAVLARQHLMEGSVHVTLGAAALAALLRHGPRAPAAAGAALATLLFVQSAAASPFALHAGQRRAATACPPPLDAEAPGPRVYTAVVHNVRTSIDGLDPIDGLQLRLGQLAVPSNNVACGIDALEGYTGFETLRAELTIEDPLRRLALSRRLGATHVLSEPPENPAEARLLQEAISGGQPLLLGADLGLWSVPHRPWASFATRVHRVAEMQEANAALSAALASGDDAVVVESPTTPPTEQGTVLSVRRDAERLELDAVVEGDALLVVNDAWAPGWVATIDGAPVEVLPADVLVRAVPFPKGRHRLEMRYEPREVAIGIWISLLTALGCAGWALARWRRVRVLPGAAPTEPA